MKEKGCSAMWRAIPEYDAVLPTVVSTSAKKGAMIGMLDDESVKELNSRTACPKDTMPLQTGNF
jgi:hypothetical protein